MTIKYVAKFVACMLLFLNSCNNTMQFKEGSSLGNIMLPTLNHQRYYLNQHKGKVNVLIFWATWCAVCKKELMAFKLYKRNLQCENMHVAAVCFNPEEIGNVKNIVNNLEIEYPVLLDHHSKLYKRLQTNAAPVTVIIDKKGHVSLVIEGFSEQIMIKIASRIELLLEKP